MKLDNLPQLSSKFKEQILFAIEAVLRMISVLNQLIQNKLSSRLLRMHLAALPYNRPFKVCVLTEYVK